MTRTPFDFYELDDNTRQLMLDELESIDGDEPASSKRFTAAGLADYPTLLREAMGSGTEVDLISSLNQGERIARSPVNAAELFGGTEFNRYYARAICRRAASHGTTEVVVYRARHSDDPSPESEAARGRVMSAPTLVDDLRTNADLGTALGIGRAGSGMSVRCGCAQCVTVTP